MKKVLGLAAAIVMILLPAINLGSVKAGSAPKISISPMSVNLGSVKAGSTSNPKTVTIKNTGNGDLIINSINITGANQSEFNQTNSCSTIPEINSCPITVTFNPTVPFGKKSAIMSISSNDPKKPTINVQLSGQAPPPTITVSPTSVNFSSAAVGNTSVPKVITIKNTGISDLTINAITITGTNATEFGQTNSCSTVAKGSSCAITAILSPTSAGSKSATMSISSNDPKKSISNVYLSGKGTGTPPQQQCTYTYSDWSVCQSNGTHTRTVVSSSPASCAGTPVLSQACTYTPPVNTGDNVLTITVNGSLCSANSYTNKPCVSLKIRSPGTSTCQTINDILLDTGSYGLRIFKQALNVSLTQVPAGSGSLAECVQFADDSSEWGPVQTASVIMGKEPAVLVPIQVIDSTFASAPHACKNPDKSPADAGVNGLLGVGLFAQDCGQDCSGSPDNGQYYACNGSSCSGTTVALSNQVQNPVALLPLDNNGVIVKLPSIPSGGSPSVNGTLVLGIGTRSNNVPPTVTMYPANQVGEFITTFNDITYSSFIDSGSNGLFFPSPSSSLLPDCAGTNSGFFCPSGISSFSATNTGAFESPSGVVSFEIDDFDSLMSSPNNVFADLGGSDVGEFDWGLPFYLGRDVYLGIDGTTSSLGNGPYWAY